MPLIDTQNLYKIYKLGDVEVRALNGVSVSIEKGEFVAVMGPSGSGKSTFMNILGCLDKPTSGKYILDGIDVTATDLSKLAGVRNHKIGFVFQGFNLIKRTTAVENVELPMIYNHTPAHLRREKALAALKAVGLEKRAFHLPNQLSGGQQQRVAIARSLVCDAPIIFADEPTGNLDTKMSIEVMDLFTRLNKEMGKTIILITHEPDIAEFASRLIKFKDGEKISDEVQK
ncbi:ABC transporter ATP-binding protein [Candidatus Avelusimicrobium sp.]|uniref:ABC transporter ATP-binding protein n=1 Tax=Candidatus Avelusimicrobium sp. TaxID=3048833 RepID=UPI003D7F05B3